MTKRTHTYFREKNNKKPKLDDDIDALWGDEIDESVFDNCISLATQVLEEVSCLFLNDLLFSYIKNVGKIDLQYINSQK